MQNKIVGELEERVKGLVLEGYTVEYISKETGLSGGTITSWCGRNDLSIGYYRNPELRNKEIRFVELIKSNTIMKHACKEVDIYDSTGISWAQRNGLGYAIRTRAEAAQDKLISFEEARARLPKGHGEMTHYDSENKVYVIKRENGTTYTRILSQVFRGDPKKGEKARIEENDVAEILSKIGYRLIPGTFRIKREPIEAEHIVCGYVRRTKLSMFPKQDCPRCSNTGTSKEERAVDEFIKSLGINTNKFRFPMDYKGKGKGKEIDIYIKDLNFGIEYCGLYNHGERAISHGLETKNKRYEKKGQKYEKTDFDSPRLCHKAKMDKASGIGIRLITIFSNEWKNSQEKVKALLKAKLGKNNIKIYARNTELRELNKEETELFMDTYHLQGYDSSSISFGLFYENELVAAISGGYHHSNGKEFCLNRLCFKANTTIVGGSGKLHSALENWAKKNGFDQIKTWSDNRWSNGSVYRAIGYELVAELEPNYFYFDNKGKTYSRYVLNKETLPKRGAIGETEWEMAQSLKLDRIFDCGKKTWVKKLV